MRVPVRALLIAPLLLAALGCGEKTFEYYRHLSVDPESLVVTPSVSGGGGIFAFAMPAAARVLPSRSSTPAGGCSVAATTSAVQALVMGGTLPRALDAPIPIGQLVSLHYDHNRLVRQERIVQGRALPTRWLSFSKTDADRVLAPRDDARSFGARGVSPTLPSNRRGG